VRGSKQTATTPDTRKTRRQRPVCNPSFPSLTPARTATKRTAKRLKSPVEGESSAPPASEVAVSAAGTAANAAPPLPPPARAARAPFSPTRASLLRSLACRRERAEQAAKSVRRTPVPRRLPVRRTSPVLVASRRSCPRQERDAGERERETREKRETRK
jgi:hypothetical protein